jgi:hypothetical protein
MKLLMLQAARLIVAITLFSSTASAAVKVEKVAWQTRVEPNASVAHVEGWSLVRNVKLPSLSDAGLDKVLRPLLR